MKRRRPQRPAAEYCDDDIKKRPTGKRKRPVFFIDEATNAPDMAHVWERLGAPDNITTAAKGLHALRWVCSKCRHIFIFDKAVRPPAPCEYCGGIAFETNTQRGLEHVRTN